MITIGGKNISDISISNKNVIRIQDAETLKTMWEKSVVTPDYFYIKNIETSRVNQILYQFNGAPSIDTIQQIEYSYDKQNWTTVTLQGSGTLCYIDYGGTVYLRNRSGKLNTENNFFSFLSYTNHEVGGDISTLIDYTNPNVPLPQYGLKSLFMSDVGLKDASNLVLPWMTLTNNCYKQMFRGCTSLTTAPSLPATTTSYSCYENMFVNCTSLTTVPALPTTTLSSRCYCNMFNGCTSLTTAPSLSATTLADYCCYAMFANCTSLTTAPSLPATTLVNSCYEYMFYKCTSLTTVPALPATTLDSRCYYNMFYGCTSLTTTQALPANTLADYCYYGMFGGCTSLNNVTTYANDISATNCLQNWLYNVAPTGTFNNYGSATYIIDSPSGIPVGWTEVKHSPYENEYFFVENKYNGNNVLHFKEPSNVDTVSPSSDYATSIQYSKDKTNWTTVDLDYLWNNYIYEFTVNLSQGEKVYFRNNNGYFTYFAPTTTDPTRRVYTIECDNSFAAGGNINSLLDYQNMSTVTLKNNCFRNLFSASSNLIDVNNLVLPSTSLAERCYQQMFTGTNISVAPTLPATTLAKGCYDSMFSSCRSLITPPTLPATTLAETCYQQMFRNCTSLTTAPVLPATTLNNSCYAHMFYGCTSLTTAPVLPSTTLAEYCYYNMFYGCTSLTTAPVLPATVLLPHCYWSMFEGCTSLNSVTTYANDISAYMCLSAWLQNVAAVGTFHKLGTATYPTGASGIPSGWTVVNN